MKRLIAVLTGAAAVATLVVAPAASASAATGDCTPITNATRTQGVIRAVSATRLQVKGSTQYWDPAAGWVPLTSYRITVQRQGANGKWTSFNSLQPDRFWQITAGPGVYRLAFVRDCGRPYAASSSRAVRAVAPKPAKRTPPSQKCHPNYTGACVPIASDVDCAGGSGNGPAYVAGPVRVVPGKKDVYGLDRDGDGVGCE